jgi:hypothetical protein
MRNKVRFLGLDVHAETIAVAVAETDGEVRSLGTIPNRAEPIRKLGQRTNRKFLYAKPLACAPKPRPAWVAQSLCQVGVRTFQTHVVVKSTQSTPASATH